MAEEEKKLTGFEERIKSKLTKDEWKKLREKLKIKDEISSFHREFRKHLSTLLPVPSRSLPLLYGGMLFTVYSIE